MYVCFMEEKEIFALIIAKRKWYAGLRHRGTGTFFTAQSAKAIINRYNKGTLSEYYIKYIFNTHGYFKPEVKWEFKS